MLLMSFGAVVLGPVALGVSSFELANRQWSERTPTEVTIEEAHSERSGRSFVTDRGVMLRRPDGSREFLQSDRLHDRYAGYGVATGWHGWTDGILEVDVAGERVRVGTSDLTLWLFFAVGVLVTVWVVVLLAKREVGEVLEEVVP